MVEVRVKGKRIRNETAKGTYYSCPSRGKTEGTFYVGDHGINTEYSSNLDSCWVSYSFLIYP